MYNNTIANCIKRFLAERSQNDQSFQQTVPGGLPLAKVAGSQGRTYLFFNARGFGLRLFEPSLVWPLVDGEEAQANLAFAEADLIRGGSS